MAGKKENRLGIIVAVLVSATLFWLGGSIAQASWFVNEKKLHISAHGQTSCVDCHADIEEQDPHPNPADVNKKRSDFFDVDKCISCHDDILDNLDEGIHGRREGISPEKYQYCIKCHKPHRQRRLGENRIGKFDPEKPRDQQCGACHEEKKALPPMSSEDEACMSCHREIESSDSRMAQKVAKFCFHCHGAKDGGASEEGKISIPLISTSDYISTPHAKESCMVCHPEAAAFGHGMQKHGDCGQCHLPHDEKKAHDSHITVSCEACHLRGVRPLKDLESQRILWEKENKIGEESRIHHMIRTDDENECKRCHVKDNQVGAVSMVLPAKSIICMPCHTSTFSIWDTTTILTLLVFIFGIVLLSTYWFSGSIAGNVKTNFFGKICRHLLEAVRAVFSKNIFSAIKTLILDVFLQRRLYRQSESRWLIHGLIFFPFMFRFLWGFIALIWSLSESECPLLWAMLNKNHPVTAFLFDMTGIIIIIGVVVALIRGAFWEHGRLQSLPKQDRVALILIGGIVIVGFLLEGMRIAMTGYPDGAAYAVVGFLIGKLFPGGSWLNQAYGYLWYCHAILSGAFIAYLPFSNLIHIILAPIIMVMNAMSQQKHGRG